MKKAKWLVVSAITVLTLSLGGMLTFADAHHGEVDLEQSVAGLVIEYVGGGKWEHYSTLTRNASNYYHDTRTHKSSVANMFTSVDSGWMKPTKWARANIFSTPGWNRAYWATN